MADQADVLASGPTDAGRDARLRILRLRSIALDCAVVLAALAGGFTCAAVLVLFLGEVRGSEAATLLFLLFGGAIVLTMAALKRHFLHAGGRASAVDLGDPLRAGRRGLGVRVPWHQPGGRLKGLLHTSPTLTAVIGTSMILRS